MLIYRNSEGVHGQRKFGNPWSSCWVMLFPVRLFQILYYKTLPHGTSAFLLLNSDFNALSSDVISLNNFIQCSHFQVVQLFRTKSHLTKVFTIIINVSFALVWST